MFDYSGHFLLYPTLCGVKIVNLETNRVNRVLGAGESNERFLAISMYQGTPKVCACACACLWTWHAVTTAVVIVRCMPPVAD